ncbi:MAG: MFS transporter [Kutzneria sp.]|nr:MFS transporter [Kutzneria sp.]
MTLTSYRELVMLPRMRPLMAVLLFARLPGAAAGVVLTLHVVLGLGLGYAAAGAVAASVTIGMAIGGPVLGRIVDRHGLRRMVAVALCGETVFWSTSPWLPYVALVVLAFAAGTMTLPVTSVSRQVLAALVPRSRHRTAFSLDSVFTEITFMVGPALGVLVATGVSTAAAMVAVGAATVLGGLGLYAVNPPVRSADAKPAEHGPRDSLLGKPMVAVLLVSTATVLVLSGSDMAIVATLRQAGQIQMSGLVLTLWSLASAVGGIVYGALRRPVPLLVLIGLMGLVTLPIGLAGQWWTLCLLLVPGGLLCAPTIAAASSMVTRLSPESARGEAMGFYQSALTVGAALGAPLVGAVVDRTTAAWGFSAAGVAGLLATGFAWVLGGRKLTVDTDEAATST